MGAPRVKRVMAVVAQVAGVLFVLWAVSLLAGDAWALLLSGVLLVGYGVLTEAGWL